MTEGAVIEMNDLTTIYTQGFLIHGQLYFRRFHFSRFYFISFISEIFSVIFIWKLYMLLQWRAHQNTWGRVSQAWKLGYEIDKVVCSWLLEMIGRDTDRCTGGSA